MTNSISKSEGVAASAGAHDKPPIPGATRVEEYDRSTGHVRGHWRMPDGRRVDSVEISGEDAQILVLSKKKDGEAVTTASIITALSDSTQSDGKLSTCDTLSDSESSIAQPADADIYEGIRNAIVDERREAAENEYIATSVLKILAKDDDEYVRQGVADNISTPVDTLRTLAKDDSKGVCSFVAGNQNTPTDVLRTLAKNDSKYVRRGVAGNENTPASILRALAKDDDDDVRISVAGNKNTSESTLRALAKDHRSKVRANVARNKNTSEDTLQSLTKDDSSIVLSTLARSENTSGRVLKTIVEDYNDKMRYSFEDDEDDHLDIDVASNKSAPGYLLGSLARSDDAQVRFAVASNPSTPYGILWQLAKDDEEHVSNAAKDRLDTQH